MDDVRSVPQRSIVLAGHKTSVSLENEFWSALREIADGRDETVPHLITRIKAHRRNANLSSAIRLFVLAFYWDQIAGYHNRRHKQTTRQTLRRIGSDG